MRKLPPNNRLPRPRAGTIGPAVRAKPTYSEPDPSRVLPLWGRSIRDYVKLVADPLNFLVAFFNSVEGDPTGKGEAFAREVREGINFVADIRFKSVLHDPKDDLHRGYRDDLIAARDRAAKIEAEYRAQRG